MRFSSLLTAAVAASLLLNACVSPPIKALPGQAKIRQEPQPPFSMNSARVYVHVDKVDGRAPQFDKDASVILAPGPHTVKLSLSNPADGAVAPGVMLLGELAAKAMGKQRPLPPQLQHTFFAESGHDYVTRWMHNTPYHPELVWIEDFDVPGRIVSGLRSPDVGPMRNPFQVAR